MGPAQPLAERWTFILSSLTQVAQDEYYLIVGPLIIAPPNYAQKEYATHNLTPRISPWIASVVLCPYELSQFLFGSVVAESRP